MSEMVYDLGTWSAERSDDDDGAAPAEEPEPWTIAEDSNWLCLTDVHRLDSLSALLNALLTPRTPLVHLQIQFTTALGGAAVLGCRQHLSQLEMLNLYAAPHSPVAGSILGALQALLEQAPRVKEVYAQLDEAPGPLPGFLAQRAWRRLRLAGGLTELPADGPYLSGRLAFCCRLARVPGLRLVVMALRCCAPAHTSSLCTRPLLQS